MGRPFARMAADGAYLPCVARCCSSIAAPSLTASLHMSLVVATPADTPLVPWDCRRSKRTGHPLQQLYRSLQVVLSEVCEQVNCIFTKNH